MALSEQQLEEMYRASLNCSINLSHICKQLDKSDNPGGKMYVPRDILLPDMDDQQPANREGAEAQRIRDEQGRAPELNMKLAKTGNGDLPNRTIGSTSPATTAKPTEYTESILKHIGILAEVTERVFAEDRIPSRQKGYSIKYVFDEVEAESNNGKGGDREEA